jgi:glycosyltransferase involved in cell wall biosynthesis
MCESIITKEMNQPLLHVMIPAYGKSIFLEQTLKAACDNLSSSALITIIEDPSEENVIEEIVSKFKHRVRYEKNSKRLGIANNFNKCLELSEGTFTQICGHDDLIIKDPSIELLSQLENEDENSNLIFSARATHSSSSSTLRLADLAKIALKPRRKTLQHITNKQFLERLMLGYWLYFPAIMWRTEVARQYKFDDQFKSAMDLDFLIDMNIKKEKFKFIDQNILVYRRHIESASSLNSAIGNRYLEEMKCHAKVSRYAKSQRLLKLNLYSKLAVGVRANATLSAVQANLIKFKTAGSKTFSN